MPYKIVRELTNPIKNLLSSATAISEGDLKRRMEVPGRDELGLLAEAFNHMAQSLETREALRKKLIANTASFIGITFVYGPSAMYSCIIKSNAYIPASEKPQFHPCPEHALQPERCIKCYDVRSSSVRKQPGIFFGRNNIPNILKKYVAPFGPGFATIFAGV